MMSQQRTGMKPKILVVEDSRTQVEILRYLLEEHGYDVFTASNGKQALSLIQESRPALVISDIVMPEMDGYELCKHIKSNPGLKEIPVILLTQLSSPSVIIKGLQCEADNFIIKPYDGEYLLSRIAHIIATQRKGEEKRRKGVDVFFAGKEYSITSERQQILDLFLSTYETAVKRDMDNVRKRDELEVLNDKLAKEIQDRKRAEKALRGSEARANLLSETAGKLLATDNPQGIVEDLCREVMGHLDCHAFFNFLADEGADRLRLNAWAGIPEEEARKIASLEYGVAVCGCAARDRCRIVSEHIPTTPDVRTELVKSFGIKAYACHPLLGHGRKLIGTLSLGTRSRETFSEADLSLMKAVTDQVAVAMERMRLIGQLQTSRDGLEIRVQERTSELARANNELQEEMTRREKAEQLLRQAQKMEAIGTLASGISHDLNNILAPIVINSEMALLDLSGDHGIRENLELINKSGLRGKDLVKQLLLFSRKSEKKQEFVTLTPMIKETFKLLRSSIPTTIQMKLHLETESDAVYGDPSQIQQVIMNLCTNAAHAMRGTTGAIDLSLRSITCGPHDLPEADMNPGTYLVLAVKDTGCGMDEEVKKRIFDPFLTTKPAGEGTGLGLSVVYGIIQDHKGNITVTSEPGRGSIFKVYLPKVDTDVLTEAKRLEPIRGRNERVLLVDDDEFVLNSTRIMLQRLGYRVTAFVNSREALKRFAEKHSEFDLVMTDQTMPFITGENLGKEMMRIRPDIPVILCTGYTDLISAEKANTSGFKGLITKPFTMREASQLVRSVLDKKRI